MKKIGILLIIILSLVAGCSAGSGPTDPIYLNDTPPIDVSVQIQDTTGTNRQFTFIDGLPRISATDYYESIAELEIPDHRDTIKLGFNPSVDATEEDLIFQGGKYVFPVAPQRMEIVSSSILDDVGSTGVTSVTISYLDNTYAHLTETILLDGTTPVPTVADNILRVNVMYTETAGTDLVAAGNIQIRNIATPTVIYRTIQAGNNVDRDGVTTIPKGFTFYCTSATVSSGYSTVNKLVQWTFRARYNTVMGLPNNYMSTWFNAMTMDSALSREFEIPTRFEGTTDIVLSAKGDSVSSIANVVLRGWIEAN